MVNPLPFDSLELRCTLGAFATGITVISIIDADGKPQGITVNSFNAVSLNPPLILWSLAFDTFNFEAFQTAKRFAVNILAEDQVAISERFASPLNDKFAGLKVSAGLGSVPLLDGCVAALECLTETTYPGGDHIIILGLVERLHRYTRSPLLYHNGNYMAVGRQLPTPQESIPSFWSSWATVR